MDQYVSAVVSPEEVVLHNDGPKKREVSRLIVETEDVKNQNYVYLQYFGAHLLEET